MRKPVRITADDGQTEDLEVSQAQRYDFPNEDETGWALLGLDPSESELLGPELKWMSGSMAARPENRMTDEGDPKFPAVYVPDDYGVTVEVLSYTHE